LRNEYVIHAKIKNNLILSRILERAKTVGQFCKENNLSPTVVGEFVNLKAPARLQDQSWSKGALELADALGCLPEELFDEEQQRIRLRTNEAFVEISRRQVLEAYDPAKHIEDKDHVQKLLAGLTERESHVIRQRFLGEQSLEQVGDAMGIGKERVRQIEALALRKMRGRAFQDDMGE
jgi:RNA polymerase sigma factor (sigma-70 family)